MSDGKALKGRSNDAIAAACMYIACRQEGVPRTFKGKSTVKLHSFSQGLIYRRYRWQGKVLVYSVWKLKMLTFLSMQSIAKTSLSKTDGSSEHKQGEIFAHFSL